MSLEAAAAAMGVPEALVQRAAEARAAASGASTDEILAAWAGGESAPAPQPTPTAEPEPEPARQPESEPERDATPEPAPEPAATPEPAGSPATVTPIAAPSEVTAREALDHPVVISVPTLGIAERTAAAVPRWLAVAFFLIPAFGLLYLSGGSADAVCSDGDVVLDADFASGILENCDGSEFEGRAAGGGGGAQFVAIGESQYPTCAACHGPTGGGGVGPPLGSVQAVFSSCLDHIEWVRLGTNGFREAGMSTYGDLAKPVGGGGVMPGFSQLSEEQLASVVAFERIRFGGGNPDEVLVDCGLVEGEAPAEGEGGATEGEGPADGTETPAEGEAALSRSRG